MFFHAVTQYSEDGKKLGTYDTTSEASKATGELISSIRDQYSGKRKYCFWYSHIYKNDIVLRDGTVIKVPCYTLSNYEIGVIGEMGRMMDEMGLKIVKK